MVFSQSDSHVKFASKMAGNGNKVPEQLVMIFNQTVVWFTAEYHFANSVWMVSGGIDILIAGNRGQGTKNGCGSA